MHQGKTMLITDNYITHIKKKFPST